MTPFGFFTLGGTRISYVAVNPANPKMVLVAAETQFAEGTTEGLYCSSDSGATWNNILPDEMATFVGFASSSVAFVAFGNAFGSSPGAPHGNGIYKSTNATTCGATFTPLTAGLPAQATIGRIDLGISPNFATDNTVYASIANGANSSSTNLGVWVTTNGGTNWNQTSAPDVCQFQCWYDNVIKVDPNNKNTVFFGGSSVSDSSGKPMWVVRSTNGGTSWSTVIPNGLSAGLPHVDTHALAFFKLPTGKVRMYMGNDGGIWRTDDAEAATVTWNNLNGSTLTLTQFYPYISINTSSPTIAFGGTQDNASQNYQGGVAWTDNRLCGDGASTAVDALVTSTVYIGCATGFQVNASYQNGTAGSFTPAVNGINSTDSSSFIPPLTVDPNSANVVYFGTTKVYQSVDAANTWTPISSDLVNPSEFYLNALAVAPGNPSVVYAGSNSGQVFVATNVTAGSASFGLVQQGILPPRTVSAIAVDPADATGNTAYVAFSGFSFVSSALGVNDPVGHIFKTTNGGNTWTDVSCSVTTPGNCATPAASDLPNIPVNDLVVDPDVPGTIYAGTDLGVYVGSCAAVPCTWSTLGTGLPRVAVLSLRLHEASRTLRAATHGRGAWDVVLNNFAFNGPRIFSLTPTSARAGGAQLTLTVNGTGLTSGTIMFDSTALTTTAIQADTQLSATISSVQLVAGTPKITVKTGTTTSNSLPFAVLALTPTLSSINPPSTPAQTPPSPPLANIPIQLTGANFANGAKVLFNGATNGVTSTFNSSTGLSATLPQTLLGPFGSTNDITVLNLPPGGGRSTPITFKVVAPAPANDAFGSAINISSLTFLDVKDSSSATTEGGDPIPSTSCVTQATTAQGNNGGLPNGTYNTIWYQFTPAFSANLSVDTVGSSYDTVLSVWSGTAGSLTSVACNDDINPGLSTQSRLSGVPLTSGTTYHIMVSSFGPPDPNPTALGGRSQLNFLYNSGVNPQPVVTSISPTSASSGDPSFTVTVNGTGFLQGATVGFINSSAILLGQAPTTFVSPTQLTAVIPASFIALAGSYVIGVQNPQPTEGFSNGLPFTVNLGTNPIPTLNSVSPVSVLATTPGASVDIFGTNIAPGAKVNLNGVPLPGTIGGTQGNTIMIPASQLTVANVGTNLITVTNPPPGGGTSNSIPFQIQQPTEIPSVTSIVPSSVSNNPPTQTVVTINGTNFEQGVVLQFTAPINLFLPATFISSTQLTFVPTGFLNTPGIYTFYVVDSFPSGFSNPVNLTVTGPPDFSFTIAAGQGMQTISAGQTATFSNAIMVNALNGFTGQVSVTCAVPAQATTCAVTPNALAGGQSANVVVTTTARGSAVPLPTYRRIILWPRIVPLVVVTLLLCFMLMRLARTRKQKLVAAMPLAGILLFLVLQAVGCGGGSSPPPPPPPPPTGTQAGTYTITVTGTSANPAVTHSSTLQLVVN